MWARIKSFHGNMATNDQGTVFFTESGDSVTALDIVSGVPKWTLPGTLLLATDDAVIHLGLLNEKNILAWWDKYKEDNHTWGSLSPNCSTIVAEAMLAGGAIPVTGLPTFGAQGSGAWSPIDIEIFADVQAVREGWVWTMIQTSTFGSR
jgi:hypothetical protein